MLDIDQLWTGPLLFHICRIGLTRTIALLTGRMVLPYLCCRD